MTTTKTYVIGGVIILAIIIGIYFMFMNNAATTSTGNPGTGSGSESGANNIVINLTASRWQYSQSTINVKKGDHVTINIDNLDTTHGIAIPDFGVTGIESVSFIADKTGTFEFHCPTMCGEGHREMTGTLIVTN